MTEPAPSTPDTTDGQRDPLSTDDGLEAAAEDMPAVDEERDVNDTTGSASSFDQPVQDVDAPGLQLDTDGTDPLAELAQPGDEKED